MDTQDWMILDSGGYHTLDEKLDCADAGIEGYCVDAGAGQVSNWLEKQVGSAAGMLAAGYIRQSAGRVAILKNLWVEEGAGNEGHGVRLLEEALGRAGADVVLLVADFGECQVDGFDLEVFFADRDFGIVLATGSGPLMAFPQEVAVALAALLMQDVGPQI